MANKVSKSKSGVKAAREAVRASQREVLERAARNADDLAVFYSSQERLGTVDEWLASKIAALREQAEAKRAEHRHAAGARSATISRQARRLPTSRPAVLPKRPAFWRMTS